MSRNSYISKKSIAKLVLVLAAVVIVGFVAQELYWLIKEDIPQDRTGVRGVLYFASLLLAFWSIYTLQDQKSSPVGGKAMRVTKIILSCFAIGGAIFIVSFVLAFVFFGVEGLQTVFSNMLLIVSVSGLFSAPVVVKRLR